MRAFAYAGTRGAPLSVGGRVCSVFMDGILFVVYAFDFVLAALGLHFQYDCTATESPINSMLKIEQVVRT